MAWEQFPESQEEYNTLKSFLELYTVQFGFYSISSWLIACAVSTVFIVVDSTQNGLRPSSQSPEITRPTKNSAHVASTSFPKKIQGFHKDL